MNSYKATLKDQNLVKLLPIIEGLTLLFLQQFNETNSQLFYFYLECCLPYVDENLKL
jgi:hypothetical protein